MDKNTYDLSCIRTTEAFADLEKEWDALFEQCSVQLPYLRHSWMYQWWDSFGADKELCIVCVRLSEKLVGIAPLMIHSKGFFGRRVLSFVGEGLSDYLDFLIPTRDEGVLSALCSFIFSRGSTFPQWETLSLVEIPERSSTLPFLQKAISQFTPQFCTYSTVGCIRLELPSREESSSKLFKKRDIRRHWNALSLKGTLQVRCESSWKTVEPLLDLLFSYHVAIWNTKGIPSMFAQEQYCNYFKHYTKKALRCSDVQLWVLYLNDHPIAIQYGFLSDTQYSTYCLSYDLAYASYSPGTLLFSSLIEEFYKRDFSEIDFSRGIESYKLRFSTTLSHNQGIIVFRSLPRYAFFKCLFFARNCIHSIPPLRKIVDFFQLFSLRLRAKYF